jgi:DNA-binding LacI/PurR family transcriptional regulator
VKAQEVAKKHGLLLEVGWSDYTLESGQALGAALVQKGVTAIVCASDMLALGAMRAVSRLHLSVPGDISVVGYDDSPMMSFTEPALTTVHQPVDRMGLAAVQNLIPLMESTKHKAIDKLVFEPQLIVRGSTARVRA